MDFKKAVLNIVYVRVAELDTTEPLKFHFSLSCNGEGNGNPLQCSCLENPSEKLLLNGKTRDSWPPEETNSILGQRRGWIAQSFCVIKFY